MKRILVPVDFSEVSKDAIRSAASLARKTGGDIVIFHVIETSVETEALREKIDNMLAMRELKDITTHYKQTTGNPIDEIVEQQLDLIVMGSEGAEGIENLVLSTLSEKVSRKAKCPVINVKKFVDLANIKSIVFPTDMKTDQSSVIKDIKALQSFYGAHLHLIKVFNDTLVLERDVEKRLEDFASAMGLNAYSVTARPNIDKAEEILEFANEIHAPMVAMGIHDRHGLGKILGGFIAKDVINHAKIAIWTKVLDQEED
ncbi:MAG: universal stress protein [Cyclobacteriaceae bacterium]